METFNNDQRLNNLSAGREFADYLTMNGWDIECLEVYAGNDHAVFTKGNSKIEYYCNDKGSTFKSLIKVSGLKGWQEQSFVHGPDLEGDVSKFAFLCHALGWVNMKEANKICKRETGENLYTMDELYAEIGNLIATP